MPAPELSVVIPVRDEAAHLPATLDALAFAVSRGGWDAELVMVDDGSTDGSGEVARTALAGRLPFRLLLQVNRGRIEARRAGLQTASGELVLLLDARVRLLPDSLRFLRAWVDGGDVVWNGHVHVDALGPLGRFWRLLAELAWREYFDHPRTTSFGVEDFDRFPKGTTCFLAPRALLVDVFSASRSRYADARIGNDDTPLLRELAARHRISISPQFACVYTPRTSVGRFFRHAVHRGTVFLDGHGTPASRFFPVAVAFYPVSATLLLVALRRPIVAPAAAVACALVAAAYGVRAGRSREDVRALALVTPLYAAGHALGMWRGLAELVRGRVAR